MLVILSLVKVHHKVTLCFCGFQSERLKKKLKVFSQKKCLFFITHFIRTNNNEQLVLDVMTLIKKHYLHFESIIYCSRLLDQKGLLHACNVGCGFGYKRKGFIRLKEFFKVSKTKDHNQQFDFLCLSSFLLPFFFDLLFFIVLVGAYSLCFGYHFFL